MRKSHTEGQNQIEKDKQEDFSSFFDHSGAHGLPQIQAAGQIKAHGCIVQFQWPIQPDQKRIQFT